MTHVDLRRMFPVRPTRPGVRWLLGMALLAGLLAAFWGSGVFDVERAVEDPGASYGAALFFSSIIAYIVPMFGYISERTSAALAALHEQLDAPPQLVAQWRERIDRKPLRWLVEVLAIGSVSGIAHNLLLQQSPQAMLAAASNSAELAVMLGTEATWIVVTLVVAALLDNALVLARAGAHARVDLLDTGKLRPFATIAVISTLAIIGAQALFPVMSIEGGLDTMAYVPGLLATGGPMLLLAALPVWPVHRRIAAARDRALRQVNARIAALPAPDPDSPDTLVELAPLLGYRRELYAVSEWPFDIGVVTRLGLYLIIPPLTWVGAALIEQMVDSLL